MQTSARHCELEDGEKDRGWCQPELLAVGTLLRGMSEGLIPLV